MNSKFFVSLEAARLLKEKGYDEKVEYMYDDSILTSIRVLTNSQIDRYYRNMYGIEFYGAPTKAEAIDWLESKGIVVELAYDNDELQKDDSEWVYYIYQYDNDGLLDETVSSWGMGEIYDTRLEAEEAAIIKALELL